MEGMRTRVTCGGGQSYSPWRDEPHGWRVRRPAVAVVGLEFGRLLLIDEGEGRALGLVDRELHRPLEFVRHEGSECAALDSPTGARSEILRTTMYKRLQTVSGAETPTF